MFQHFGQRLKRDLKQIVDRRLEANALASGSQARVRSFLRRPLCTSVTDIILTVLRGGGGCYLPQTPAVRCLVRRLAPRFSRTCRPIHVRPETRHLPPPFHYSPSSTRLATRKPSTTRLGRASAGVTKSSAALPRVAYGADNSYTVVQPYGTGIKPIMKSNDRRKCVYRENDTFDPFLLVIETSSRRAEGFHLTVQPHELLRTTLLNVLLENTLLFTRHATLDGIGCAIDFRSKSYRYTSGT